LIASKSIGRIEAERQVNSAESFRWSQFAMAKEVGRTILSLRSDGGAS
jgi:hypothetical protein